MPARRALLVGINDYGSAQNNLPSCVNDVTKFASFLSQTYGFADVHKLTDGAATRARVEAELEWLFRNATKEDRLVFFYSGHGYTKLMSGVYEEFLVLRDGLWQDDQLSAKTQGLPDGVLTVILDSCFSGGMLKLVMDPMSGEVVEVAKTKTWTPEGGEKAFEPDGIPAVATIKRFGVSRVTGALNVARVLRPDMAWTLGPFSPAVLSGAAGSFMRFGTTALEVPASKGPDDEPNQTEMKGILLSASLPTETAAASTSKTNGMSAFTYALLTVLARLGKGKSAEEVLKATEGELRNLRFAQTPLVLEPASPGNLKRLGFITLGAEGAQVTADARFWGAFGSIIPSIFSSVSPTILNAIRGRAKGFPAEVVGSEEDADPKFFAAIAPLIPSLVSTVAPMVVSALTRRRRRKSLDDVSAGVTAPAETTEDDIVADEKFWGAIATVLPSVVSTVAPMIINAMAGRRKSADYVSADAGAEGDFAPEVKFWGSLSMLSPMVSALTPVILEAMSGRRKGFVSAVDRVSMEEDTDVVADEKFWGAFAAVFPSVIHTCAPMIIDAVLGAQEKAAEAPGEAEAAADEKFWRAIRDAMPSIIERVGPVVLECVTGRRKGFNAVEELTGNASPDKADKFWGAIASFVPQLVQACAPVIIEAIRGTSRRKEAAAAGKGLQAGMKGGYAPKAYAPKPAQKALPPIPRGFLDDLSKHVTP